MRIVNAVNKLENGNLLLAWWANNKGRGKDNCTLMVVPDGTKRASLSRDQKNVLTQTRTSSWRGSVNLSKRVCDDLGIGTYYN